MSNLVREAVLKARTLEVLKVEGRLQAESVITSEYRLGASGVRADLAILDQGVFTCIEIKSAGDNLRRLPRQVEVYRRASDWTIIVLATGLYKTVPAELISGLEVWEATARGKLVRRRAGRPRKSLLTANIVDLLPPYKIRGSYSAEELRFQFEREFATRFASQSAAFWRSASGREVSPEDIDLLSRYKSRREMSTYIEAKRAATWQQWGEC